jgi:hypothetical protein
MAASYPSNVKSFVTKVDFVDTVIADHVNSLQEETVAVQTALGTSPTVSSGWIGSFDSTTTSWATVKARVNNLEYGLKNVYDKIGGTNVLPVVNGGTGIASFGTGVATALGVSVGSSGAFVTNGGALGTPSSGTLSSCTGLPLTTGISGTLPVANGGTGITSFGTGIATWLGTPSSSNLASAVTDETGSGSLVFGTGPTITPAAGTTTTATSGAGYMGMPQNSTGTGITLAASDAGKHIYVTTTGQTITIPSNGSVAFPVGTTIVVVNADTVSTTIAITSDTLRLANTSSTGSRTLASNGMCTLLKVASTTWIASGNGLT